MKELILKKQLPLKTESYTPIAHKSFIESIEKELKHTDYKIKNTNFIANKTMTKLVGSYILESNDGDIGPMIGFRNSYDKSMSAGLVTGASVFICENGVIDGEIIILRKHTGTADLEIKQHIFNEVNNLQIRYEKMLQFKQNISDVELDSNLINQIIGDLYFQDNIIKAEQLSILKKEYFKPTINYGVDQNNAWNIYNLLTYAIEQKAHPMDYLTQHGKVFNYFEDNILT